jgi:hypothetical protein
MLDLEVLILKPQAVSKLHGIIFQKSVLFQTSVFFTSPKVITKCGIKKNSSTGTDNIFYTTIGKMFMKLNSSEIVKSDYDAQIISHNKEKEDNLQL